MWEGIYGGGQYRMIMRMEGGAAAGILNKILKIGAEILYVVLSRINTISFRIWHGYTLHSYRDLHILTVWHV